jgi:hypothetical protein
MTLLSLLTIVFFVMLIVGLIKPSKVVFWSETRTRGKALLIYGVGTIVCFTLLGIFAPDDATPKKNIKEFGGKVVFETTIEGEESDAKELAEFGIAKRTIIQFGENGFLCTEEGGLSNGTLLKNGENCYFLNHSQKTATKGNCGDIDANVTDELKKFLPYAYKTELDRLNETITICGYSATKYKVLKSQFVRDYATAYVWITSEIKFPLRRFDFQTNYKRMVTPIPLVLINDIGAILKAEVHETGVIVTYIATSIDENEVGSFNLPEDYQIVEEE